MRKIKIELTPIQVAALNVVLMVRSDDCEQQFARATHAQLPEMAARWAERKEMADEIQRIVQKELML